MNRLSIKNGLVFAIVMRDREMCLGLLNRIFRDRKVIDVRFQDAIRITSEATVIEAIESKSVRLDILVEGIEDEGKAFWADLEMQVEEERDLILRARYAHGITDVSMLRRGDEYGRLRAGYVVYICSFDPFSLGRGIYSFRMTEDETGLKLNDEYYTIYVNTKAYQNMEKEGDDGFYSLLEYIDTGKLPEGDEYLARLDEKVMELTEKIGDRVMRLDEDMKLREIEVGKRERAKGREEGLAEGRSEGLAEGRSEERREMVKRLVSKGLITAEEASAETGMPLDEIERLCRED